MPLLQKRHVLTLARRVITCLIMRKKGIGFERRVAKYSGL
ncbi:hypothetical protein SEEN0624_20865, partial [Salmonella enterica subsp. enterica serovar Newport str. PRS_2010_0624]